MDNNIPDIKPQVNREGEGKKAGLLAGLLSKLGLGGGGSASGVGLGISGGLLATKAGIVALVLVGTTMAGSLGIVGYKLFGPSASDRTDADYTSLFAAKPPAAAGRQGQDPNGSAASSGVSGSLDYLAQANAKKELTAEEKQAAEAAAAAESAKSAQASAHTVLNNDNTPGQGPAAKLNSATKKFGELKGFGSSGSSGGGSGGNSPVAGNPVAGAKGSVGSLGMGRPTAAGGGSRAVRSLGGGRNTAMRQLGSALRNNIGATNSKTAGATYDGSNVTPGGAPDAGASPAGVGAGSSAADRNTANPTATGSDRFPPVPSVAGVNVTPWQAAIKSAIYMTVAAIVLLALADKVSKMANLGAVWAKGLAIALAGLAALMGLAIVAFGAMIGKGEYGQPLQGGILTLTGVFITGAAAAAISGLTASGADKIVSSGISGGAKTLMYICGGAALAATAVAYMAKPKSYPPDLFKDGRAPDWDHKYESAQAGSPSDQVLDRYLA
ncbi:MAG: hypothetical protein WC881_09565 [Elusimicrobiota bacterium]|jgi:hypothetical protein